MAHKDGTSAKIFRNLCKEVKQTRTKANLPLLTYE